MNVTFPWLSFQVLEKRLLAQFLVVARVSLALATKMRNLCAPGLTTLATLRTMDHSHRLSLPSTRHPQETSLNPKAMFRF